jgi:hypothetical protein
MSESEPTAVIYSDATILARDLAAKAFYVKTFSQIGSPPIHHSFGEHLQGYEFPSASPGQPICAGVRISSDSDNFLVWVYRNAGNSTPVAIVTTSRKFVIDNGGLAAWLQTPDLSDALRRAGLGRLGLSGC